MRALAGRHPYAGLVALVLSSAAFGTSGPFAKALMDDGWSAAAVVLVRVTGAALVLAPAVLLALRGRWRSVAHALPAAAAYGMLGVATAQLGYFQAVSRMPVAVALLLEFLGTVLVVGWMWLTTRRPPHRLTVAGVALALTGLALVLDVTGAARPEAIGIVWGLVAATGLAGHFVIAARPTPLPALAFAGLGLAVGAAGLGLAGALGVVPLRTGGASVAVAGAILPSWAALAELVLVAAVLAYVLGIVGARLLGSTVASFVGLTEVLFALVAAWLLLAELPGPVQLLGGLVLLAGVVLVRLGERPRDPADAPQVTEEPTHQQA